MNAAKVVNIILIFLFLLLVAAVCITPEAMDRYGDQTLTGLILWGINLVAQGVAFILIIVSFFLKQTLLVRVLHLCYLALIITFYAGFFYLLSYLMHGVQTIS